MLRAEREASRAERVEEAVRTDLVADYALEPAADPEQLACDAQPRALAELGGLEGGRGVAVRPAPVPTTTVSHTPPTLPRALATKGIHRGALNLL